MELITFFHSFNQVNLFASVMFSIMFVTIFHFLYFKKTCKLNLPPSPPKLPLLGNLHQLGGSLHRSMHTISQKHGPLVLLRLVSAPFLVVSSAELAKEIMKRSDSFPDRVQTRAAKVLFYECNDVVFSPLGDYWRQARKICSFQLLSQKRVHGFQFAREEEVRTMVDKIRGLCNTVVDINQIFEAVSSNIVSRSAFGRVYKRENGDKSFGELSKRAMDLIGAFCFKDIVPCLGWLDVLTGLTKKLNIVSHELNAFLDQVIEEHKVARVCDAESHNEDIVDILLHLQRDGMLDPILTQDNLKAILLDMFFGGTDTASTTMEWIMADLVINPRILKKSQEEVRRVVGKTLKITEDDLTEMDYLKCIIKETLRLHNPFIISRKTHSSTKLDGYDIPAKATVLINSWAIQRDPSLWDMPEEFIPERFLNSSVDFKGHHPGYIPFGAGKRSCPGVAYAMAEVEYVIANLLYWFDWELPGDLTARELNMSDTYAATIRKSKPLCLVPKLHYF